MKRGTEGSRRCGNYIIIVVWKLPPGGTHPTFHSLPGHYEVPPQYLDIYKSTCTILIINRTRTVPTVPRQLKKRRSRSRSRIRPRPGRSCSSKQEADYRYLVRRIQSSHIPTYIGRYIHLNTWVLLLKYNKKKEKENLGQKKKYGVPSYIYIHTIGTYIRT